VPGYPRLLLEVDGGRVAAADKDPDALASHRRIGCRQKAGQRRGPAGLGHDPQRGPEHFLSAPDVGVAHQHHAFDVHLGDGEHQLADAARRQRVRRDASGRCVDGPPRAKGFRQGRGRVRFDPDDLRAPRIPGGDAADQPTAADGHQQRVDGGGLYAQFQSDRALAEQGFDPVIGVDRHRARRGHPFLAGRQRVGVAIAPDDQLRAVLADALDLRRRGHRGDEDLGAHAESPGGVGDGGAVIAARGGHHARSRDLPHQQVGEGAPRLERARVLELLELEHEAGAVDAEIGAGHLHHRRPANVRPDDRVGGLDGAPIGSRRHAAILTWT
jgi:hypothetical protein